MTTITAVISKGKDDYGVWLEEVPGIYSAGATLEEAKMNIYDAIALYLDDDEEVPAPLAGEYELKFVFELQSFLVYYSSIFSTAGLERITGINQKALEHYVSGDRRPRPKQIDKLNTAIKKLSTELSQVNFV